jgi:hypothetical protein
MFAFNDEAALKEGLMSVMTIKISTEHIEPIRESLLTARRALEEQLSTLGDHPPAVREQRSAGESSSDRLGELDSLLEQLDSSEGSDSGLDMRELTGTRAALWTVVYDAACAASERLAEHFNEYWRGTVDAGEMRAQIADLGTRVELLESLGPPPGE